MRRSLLTLGIIKGLDIVYSNFCTKNMIKFRLLRAFIFIFLFDVYFDVDSKSTIGFRRLHIVFELCRVQIIRKNLLICEKKIV